MKTASNATKDVGYTHTGHRQKLRARFLKFPETVSDTDLIELGLMCVIPRCDVRPIAKRLLERFHTILGILQAPIEELIAIDGIHQTSAAFLKVCLEIALRTKKLEVIQRPILENWENLVDYCRLNYAYKTEEELHLLVLNTEMYLMEDVLVQTGTAKVVSVPVEAIAHHAILKHANSIILVHNHPTGNATPSSEDIKVTRMVRAALCPLGIDVWDSLIVGKTSVTSLRRDGLF